MTEMEKIIEAEENALGDLGNINNMIRDGSAI